MALRHQAPMIVQEYFLLEESDPETWYEYADGHVSMLSSGSANRATISSGIYALLRGLLRGGPYRAYNLDMRVQVSETRYFHPDVMVSCDPGDRGTTDLLQSPRIVGEVLSPSTEVRDRGRKLQYYLACPLIEEYLLVSSAQEGSRSIAESQADGAIRPTISTMIPCNYRVGRTVFAHRHLRRYCVCRRDSRGRITRESLQSS